MAALIKTAQTPGAADSDTANTANSDSATAHPRLTLAERLESLKAAIVGGLAALLVFIAITLLHQAVSQAVTWAAAWPDQFLALQLLAPQSLAGTLIGAIGAALSGFLFGITYRYIIRHDRNPHLKSGAVLAFGLVRASAQIEAGLQADVGFLRLAVAAGESLLLFAIARLALDAALAQGWLKRFPAD